MPHPQSNHELPITPKPSPQVTLLTPGQAGQRVRSAALAHYVHALVATIEDFFVEHQPTQGMDLCLAVALLPDGESIVRAELRPNALSESTFTELLGQVQALPRPPVPGGPVAFLVQSLVVDWPPRSSRSALSQRCPGRLRLCAEEGRNRIHGSAAATERLGQGDGRLAAVLARCASRPSACRGKARSDECLQPEGGRTHPLIFAPTEMIENRPNCDSPYLCAANSIMSGRNTKRPSPTTANILPGRRATPRSISTEESATTRAGVEKRPSPITTRPFCAQSSRRGRSHAAGQALA